MLGWLKDWLEPLRALTLRTKIYACIATLVTLVLLLVAGAILSSRLQQQFREEATASVSAALYAERANRLIYAVVMESRGVYMSPDSAKARLYAMSLLDRNRELAAVLDEWQGSVRHDDAEQFASFKRRVNQFIVFRNELARRAVEVSPAAGREWGDNDANRATRTALTEDLEALGRIYVERAARVSELGRKGQLSEVMMITIGLAVLAVATFLLILFRNAVLRPISDIVDVTRRIAQGKIRLAIPHLKRSDEIGQLAQSVQGYQDAMFRILELQEQGVAAGKERDELIGERDRIDDKYNAAKWQLAAALNNMAQGLVMLDARACVLVANDQYRKMYNLPQEATRPGTMLSDILKRRQKLGLFSGDADRFVGNILARIARRHPSTTELELPDGRTIKVYERPMDGGGWVATHEDVTEQQRLHRQLERTEQFLVSIIENVPEAIIAKDARDLRYIFVNRAAEKLYGIARGNIIGKTAREIFPEETATLIESHDKKLLAENCVIDAGTHRIRTPGNGERLVAVRRIPIIDGGRSLLLSMIHERESETQRPL
ncbi:MAG: PAS-domain containing protein [Pseudomonadota bacterium]